MVQDKDNCSVNQQETKGKKNYYTQWENKPSKTEEGREKQMVLHDGTKIKGCEETEMLWLRKRRSVDTVFNHRKILRRD